MESDLAADQDVAFSFKVTLNDSSVGGSAADKAVEFEFTVTLSDTNIGKNRQDLRRHDL